MQDLLLSFIIAIPALFTALMAFDFMAGLLAICSSSSSEAIAQSAHPQPPVPPHKLTLSEIMDRPEIVLTLEQEQELQELEQFFDAPWDEGIESNKGFIDAPIISYSEWLQTDLEDADRWDGTPYRELEPICDPWDAQPEHVSANISALICDPQPRLQLLLPSAKPVASKKSKASKKAEPVAAAPKKRGRPRKAA